MAPDISLAKPATLDDCLPYVLENEGGYTNDPADPGGATNFGITAEDLARYLKHPVNPDDVQKMSRDTARSIYLAFYWQPMHLSSCLDIAKATAILDCGVLYGIHTGVKYAQIALNNLGANISPDGVMGTDTMNKLNTADRGAFIKGLYGLIVERINTIVAANPSLAKFEAGWMNRANRLLTLI